MLSIQMISKPHVPVTWKKSAQIEPLFVLSRRQIPKINYILKHS